MQDMREEHQAEEQQIAQERAHAEGHLEARVLQRPIRELLTLQPAITLPGAPYRVRPGRRVNTEGGSQAAPA